MMCNIKRLLWYWMISWSARVSGLDGSRYMKTNVGDMMSGQRAKRPAVGDRVEVYDAWNDEWVEGMVESLLSEQFSWIDTMEDNFITRYDGAWRLKQ